jgi:predicted ArsR family transcriptional regulator
MANDLTPSEIADSLGLQARILKPHLSRLVKAGIIARKQKLKSGRKVLHYGITQIQNSTGFAQRRYFELSASLIDGIRKSIGEDGARMILRDIGLRIGKDIVQSMSSRFNVAEWNPGTYSEYFVNGVLAEMQTHPRIIDVGKAKILYEQQNCPFQELATRNPVLICDVLDEAVHKGVDSNLGASNTTRLKCKGHGDLTCRYLVEWRARRMMNPETRSRLKRKISSRV